MDFPLPPPPFRGDIRQVSLRDPLDWLAQGWAIFLARPNLWLGGAFGMLVLSGGLIAIFLSTPTRGIPGTEALPALLRNLLRAWPLLAGLAVLPLCAAGALRLCVRLADAEPASASDTAWGLWGEPRKPLLRLGALLAAGGVLLLGLLHLSPGPISLVLLLLGLSGLGMAACFSPALVALSGASPAAALKSSLLAVGSNFGAFAVYAFILLVLHTLAILSLGLGLLVLWPVIAGANFAAFRDVFPES